MKPRNKIETTAFEISQTLPVLTKEQVDYAYNKLFGKQCFANKSTANCLECGGSIDLKKIIGNRATCECCGSKLKVIKTLKKNEISPSYLFALTSVVKTENNTFQVVRNFEISTVYKKGYPKKIYCNEICQNWLYDKKRVLEDGYTSVFSEIIIAKNFHYFSGSFVGDLTIKVDKYGNYKLSPYFYLPQSRFLEEFEKKGVNSKNIGSLNLYKLRNRLFNPKAETLLKAGYSEVVFYFQENDLENYWSALKICIRNKYKIKDVLIYKDLLQALSYLNKDLRNSFYVCPKDLTIAHDLYIKLQDYQKTGKKISDNLLLVKKENPLYIKEKSKFFDLCIKKGNIKIEPLKDVIDFLKEGYELSHCVFSNSYYKKKESLLLSAKVDNKRTETIEVSLEDFTINQCRGFKNKDSRYHHKITELVNNNIPSIKKIALAV